MLKKIISLVVACFCAMSTSLVAVHASDNTTTVETSNQSTSKSVEFADGCIIERISVDLGDHIAYVQRITKEDNTSTLTVEEYGKVSTFIQEVPYDRLYENLKGNSAVGISTVQVLRGRVPGYNYRYVTSFTHTDYLTPQNGQYATILAVVSGALGVLGIPGATITAVASLIFSNSSSAVETKLITNRYWYEMTEKASGAFIGYHCEFVVGTYVKNSAGSWICLGSNSGEFDSSDVY